MFSRRAFLRILPLAAAGALGGQRAGRESAPAVEEVLEEIGGSRPVPGGAPVTAAHPIEKIRDFDRRYADDFLLPAESHELLRATAARIERARDLVGHGNFNLLGFDELLRVARNFPDVGAFARAERAPMDELFHADAAGYGFRGAKVLTEITAVIPRGEVTKIAGSGHYLMRGEPMRQYRQIREDLGENIVLTSGVRGVVKQFQLFLSKAVSVDGNLSQASRSLAPPGYSYHATGDFDVGKRGFGLGNFSEEFCETEEYRRLIDLGYVAIRYTPTNPFGVRHEPWHIKVG